ncbi:MAG: hypothetical protein L0H31_04120 [Nocardioidaceae bacterium]|nr:hypothetical protein [Nocardioidaceae bacterium]
MSLAPIPDERPFPVSGAKLLDRLRLTLLAVGYVGSGIPSVVLAILTVVCFCLGPALGVGVLLAMVVFPAVAGLAQLHRIVSGRLLGEEISADYVETAHLPALVRPIRWLRDPARWRTIGFVWFSATGGWIMSLVPVALLTMPVTWFVLALSSGGWIWLPFLVATGPVFAAWWLLTPPLLRARAVVDRAWLGNSRLAREGTVSALDDLRSVVRGIQPPVLADRGLGGTLDALALALPVPVSVAVELPRLPEPVESAAYFAAAECFANIAKHAQAARAWVTGSYDGDRLRLTVGDDGRGGADPRGSGLVGVARRLDAFDGSLRVHSPSGGPTVCEIEVPWRRI